MRAVFISYRRDDSEGHAGRLYEDLTDRFGREAVFMDVARIEAGRDFRRAIEEQIASCGVLLVIIGKTWLDAKNANGDRRLDDPTDFVRLETAAALKREIPVIPVLVQNAEMPRQDQLPEDLRELAYRNSVELTHARWPSDVRVLIEALLPHVDAASKVAPEEDKTVHVTTGSRASLPLVAFAVAALALVVLGWVVYQHRGAEAERGELEAEATRIAAAAQVTAAAGATETSNATQREVVVSGTAIAAAKETAAAEVRMTATAEAQRREAEQTATAAARPTEVLVAVVPTDDSRRDPEARATAMAARSQAAAARTATAVAGDRLAQANATRRAVTAARYRCIPGYVWREAVPGDFVCVTPEVRRQAQFDNDTAERHRDANGSRGPDSCIRGYVWRLAVDGDHVCVKPDVRRQVVADNEQASQRVVPSARRRAAPPPQ